MAFTIKSAASSGIYAKLVVTELSQSVANNTTTLQWQLYMWNTQAKPTWYAYEEHNIFRIQINNQYVLNTENFGMVSLQYEQTESTAKLITSGTITIAHNSDGTKTGVPVSLYGAQGWYMAYVWEASGTMNLTTIARASVPTLSASTATLGGNVTIYTNRASTAFTHTLKYSIGSASGTIETGVADSYKWTPIDKELARQFPNKTSGVVTITCETYNGSTPIGSNSIQLTVNISDDMVPVINSVNIYEAGSIPSGITGYIQSRSKLKIVVSASGIYGSTISSYKIVANGSTYNTADETTGYLTTAGSNKITVEVKDSRGKPKTYETNVTVVEYKPPRLDSWKAYRCDAQGNANEQGEYIKIDIAGTITSLSSKNAREILLQTRKPGGNWGDQSITISSGYSFTGSSIIAAEITSSYEVRVFVGDSFTGLDTSPYTMAVSTASILMNIHVGENGVKDGIAFGKMAEKAKTVQLGWDLELKGDPTADNHAVNKKYVDNRDYPYMDVYTPGSYNVDECYDAGLYEIAGGTNLPTGSYGSLLSLPYRKRKGNTKPDYGVQIYGPNGDNASKPNSLFYRTALENTWNKWNEIATTDGTVANIANDTIGTDVDLLAYALTLPEHTVSARRIASGAVNIPTGQTWGTAIIQRQGGVDATIIYQSIISKGLWVNVSNSGNWSGWVRVLDTNIVSDYPVAQGTSGIWHYVKYNSGLAMCWGNTGIYNTAFTATWNGWYVHDYLFPAQRFPFDFVEIPMVFASQGKHGNVACEWSWYSGGEATTQYTPRYSPFRPKTTGATVNLSLNLFAIGRWK